MEPPIYSVELPNTRTPGQTGIYRNAYYPKKLVFFFFFFLLTAIFGFSIALKISKDRNCIGHRPYNKITKRYEGFVWQTYKQVAERVTNFGSGLMHLSETVVKNPKSNQWCVGLYSNNRPEWFITDQANVAYNLITVAIYDTFGPHAVEYIINHSEIPIVVAGANRIPGLIQNASKMRVMKVIISMDELDENDSAPAPIDAITTGKVLKEWARAQGILLLDFAEVERLGQQYPRVHNIPTMNDLACICYTSGTTGVPKGALLTHENFIGAKNGFDLCWNANQDDVLISYLPLAHVLGRMIEVLVVSSGASIGYFRGNVLTIIDDMAELKPTIFPSVPRLLTRVFAKLQQNTVNAPGIKGALSRTAVSAKLKNLVDGKGYTHTIWDKIIFNKIKQVLGGRVRLILTGSAPIAPEILQFLRIAFSCDIAEGYGQTEGICAATMTLKGENVAGHVGGPIPFNEIKLVDVPEMNYFSTDKPFPRGELCYRGPSVFRGYYKDDVKTKETIDKEGWLHSGDIAYINERGAFCIIDRKKNIFKLSHGEYVAPEKIENAYVNSNLILQIFVHGDSLRDYLVAIVVPDPETFVPWANALTKKNVSLGDEKGLEILVYDKKVKRAFLGHMDEIANQSKLKGFEMVKDIHLSNVPFSVENNILTPTLKLKRHEAQKHFRKIIDKLYAEHETEPPKPNPINYNTKAKL
ncbi:hypothetical protein C2G38_2296505 [Gigaspora rosea]|uniref:Long-chain-fatty-acid--CoA ligase n=1 Tax=Gigaspora rosea TaxID=44941 RepID=A0A397TY12_9GLOM|nr:hypothetical protein C2G38_2296505 [Gigaspora rosea]